MDFDFSPNDDGITLKVRPQRAGLLPWFRTRHAPDINYLPREEREVAFAMADLRMMADQMQEPLEIAVDSITLTHRLAAVLDAKTGAALGLPPLTDHTLRTDAEGIVGDPGFRLHAEWIYRGRHVRPTRQGAILHTEHGAQRLPLWILDALDIAERHHSGQGDAADWEALARFRRALDPGVAESVNARAAKLSMTDFLSGLEVSLVDRFSISPDAQGRDFEVVPFSGETIGDETEIREDMAELNSAALTDFQRKLRQRGALNSFRLGPGKFLVVDRSAAPVLDLMARMQRAPAERRAEFIRNPRPAITEMIEKDLDACGALKGLSDAAREERIEDAAGPAFIETTEYGAFSARVTGVEVYAPPTMSQPDGSGTTWLPEFFPEVPARQIKALSDDDLRRLGEDMRKAIESGQETVPLGNLELPATPEAERQITAILDARKETGQSDMPWDESLPEQADSDAQTGPIVLKTAENFNVVSWRPAQPRRAPAIPERLPQSIRTQLKDHQVESFEWQIAAWKAGLPGVLNADEQGLGKTLQTISFLVWLNGHMAQAPGSRGPILVVAPTSLLQNWEAEVDRHVERPGLGHLIRLYGSGIGARRLPGGSGVETGTGEGRLDFSDLERATQAGAGHLTWVLTTYTTLTNYQHSLGRVPFAAAVFDEIQAIKNPVSLRAGAARAIKADFRVALTGTPIENATSDLWAIMDQVAPGCLGSLAEFRTRYGTPDEGNMAELYNRVFCSQETLPPLAIRRVKETAAQDLPAKSRVLVPREMAPRQARVYDLARRRLAEGTRGSALKLLHHIRSVSVHPSLVDGMTDEDFISASARLSATMEILHRIRDRKERALVFIEHRRIQYRFVELARAEFGLNRIDMINGETPIRQRQEIVKHFQRHLEADGGFDLLVLGPKAAGTGLTLTAATHVIHLSRWWNPAVEEQCNDRVHRIGQTRTVSVYIPMAIHPAYRGQSFDCLLHSLMQRKRHLASSALWPMGDTQEDAARLQGMVIQDATNAISGDAVTEAVEATFKRDCAACPPPGQFGEYPFG
ncbi:DEAD/DEAH box helicase [Rhodovulum sulfidophilum]|uniref:DEAD/DEAH box helicase n=1 Tax=Rhodovulum sulfidophilum TaxID=35806 RepID=UPI001F46A852|nr:DEAD/DEAH box helicase [Rhodovulum sulfidophilum]